MKKTVITDVYVKVSPPRSYQHDTRGNQIDCLRRDASDFMRFVRGHGDYVWSRGSVYNWDIEIIEEKEERCEFCGEPWTTAIEDPYLERPCCCEKAVEEFEKNATERDTPAAS